MILETRHYLDIGIRMMGWINEWDQNGDIERDMRWWSDGDSDAGNGGSCIDDIRW